jgi:uncharacterized protein YjbI with pentapeptide repeats
MSKSRKKGEEVIVRTLVSDELLHAPDPPGQNDSLQNITAEQAMAMISAGDPLIGLRVKGDVNLGQQNLEYPVEAELEGQKVVIAGLPGPPPFSRIALTPDIDIRGCFFEGHVALAGLHFKGTFGATSTAFHGGLNAQHSVFDRGANFFRSSFEGKCVFSDVTFWDTVYFAHASFLKADFFNVLFQKEGNFSEALFHDVCNFSMSRFMMSQPYVCLDFHLSKFREATYFKDAVMDGIADFSGANFREQADFLRAAFRTVNFTNAKFGRLDLKWEQIEGGRLMFGEIVLPAFEKKPVIHEQEWTKLLKERKDADLPDKHRQYDILKAIFISQGDHVSADDCFYEWKQVERRQTQLGWNPENWMVKAFHFLNWLSCGYGVKPIRTVLFALALVLLFALAYTILDPSFVLAGGASGTTHDLHLALKNLDFSASVFMNFDADASGLVRTARLFFVTERLLGWLTLLLFVTTYTRLMLR